VNQLRIFYREGGPDDAPVLLLLHGFPWASHQYARLMERLSDRIHVVAPDYPGFGYSSSPASSNADGNFVYTFDRLADVTEAFPAALGIDRFFMYVFASRRIRGGRAGCGASSAASAAMGPQRSVLSRSRRTRVPGRCPRRGAALARWRSFSAGRAGGQRSGSDKRLHPATCAVEKLVVTKGERAMPTEKPETFETIPVGTSVTRHYRSAIGHGTVKGIHELGTNADNTMYSIEQHDHHPGEPAILHRSGKALTVVKS
jgi:hypothetical protein